MIVLGIFCASSFAATTRVEFAPSTDPATVEHRLYVSTDDVTYFYVGNNRNLTPPVSIGSGPIPELVPVYFRVTAVDALGIETDLGIGPGGDPVLTYVAPLSACPLWSQTQSIGKVILTWRHTNISHTGYQIGRSTDGSTITRVFNVLSPEPTQFTDTTVVQGTRYFYQIRAMKNGVAGPWSNLSEVVAEK